MAEKVAGGHFETENGQDRVSVLTERFGIVANPLDLLVRTLGRDMKYRRSPCPSPLESFCQDKLHEQTAQTTRSVWHDRLVIKVQVRTKLIVHVDQNLLSKLRQ